MPSSSLAMKGGWRAVAAVLLAFVLVFAETGCGKRDPAQPQETPSGSTGAPQSDGPASGGQGGASQASARGFGVFVSPVPPNRIAPASISVKSPPGEGAEVLGVRWFVNGTERDNGKQLLPDRFDRGDRIHAVVRVRTGAEEMSLTTPEVVAGNALPNVADVRIEPQAPTSGSTVRAVVQAEDPDDDPVTVKYRWYVDDAEISGQGGSLTLKGVRKGSWVHVAATPNDGSGDGAWKYSPRYLVVNAPPVVKSEAPTTMPASRVLTHEIVAQDPDGDPLTYTLVSGPAGCSLSGAVLTWKVADSDLGRTSEIVVRIADNDGASTILKLSLNPLKP
ncbi:MAG: hypothetical protein D4R80_01960 [Deltaproteobacteria bacterium]|nr:MAG: hypothetical protein D4R80_01960 [Deltaproteobacteria bacterium]